jgi:hypothetical protein
MANFSWSEFNGRCRARLLAGLALMVLGLGYATWGTARLAGADVRSRIDGPVVDFARRLVAPPQLPHGFRAANDRERMLVGALVGRQDALFGLTLLVLRSIVAMTVAGLGLVLLTAGSTEWEIRSELAATSRASS